MCIEPAVVCGKILVATGEVHMQVVFVHKNVTIPTVNRVNQLILSKFSVSLFNLKRKRTKQRIEVCLVNFIREK